MIHHIYPHNDPANGVSVYGAQIDRLMEGVSLPERDIWHFELNYARHEELWAAEQWCRQNPGQPYVVTLHDPPVVCGKPFERYITSRSLPAKVVRKTLDVTLGRLIVRRVVREAKVIIVLNGLARPVVARRFGVPESRIVVSPLLPSLPPPAGPVQATSKPVKVLQFGVLAPRKGVEDLLRAAAVVPDIDLTIFGGARGDNPGYEDRLKAMAAELGLAGRVHFTGYGDDAALRAALLTTDIVALPYHEADVIHASGPLTTALAFGRAVVASNLPIFADKLTDESMGLMFTPGSVPELAAQLKGLVAAPERITHLGQSAYTWMAEHHNPEHVKQQLVEIYQSL